MGFIIKQPLETNQGLLLESYVRIEMYRVELFYGLLHVTVAMYPSRQAAQDTVPMYFGEVNPNPSQVVGVNIVYKDEEMEYPTYFQFPLVKEIELEIPVMEERVETKTSTYYDFDEKGDIVQKERQDEIRSVVQVGTQKIPKQKIDINKNNGNIYSFAYEQIKKEYGAIFGDENIIDE